MAWEAVSWVVEVYMHRNNVQIEVMDSAGLAVVLSRLVSSDPGTG